jgi:hypothetical protein
MPDRQTISARVEPEFAAAVTRFAEYNHQSIADFLRSSLVKNANLITKQAHDEVIEEIRVIELLRGAAQKTTTSEEQERVIQQREQAARKRLSELEKLYGNLDELARARDTELVK